MKVEDIKFTVPESWKGKNILVMPYMNQSVEKTAANLKVEIDPTTIGKSCGIEYRDSITCVKYNSNYGPKYGGSITLNDYSCWNILLDSNKITLEEQSIIMGVSENEDNLDAVQSYDSEIVTVGAMQKTINPDGYGEFPTQMAEFKDEYPDLFEQLFTNCGWSVEKENDKWRVYYSNKTGQDLKNEIRENCSGLTCGKKIKAIPIEPLINAAKNEVFQSKQIHDFIARLNNRVLKVVPSGYSYSLKEYMKSKLGKATVLDHHINRPAYVATDFGKALDRFFKKNPGVSNNPSEWKKKHNEYEKSILDDYGVNRRGTDMANRYQKMSDNDSLK